MSQKINSNFIKESGQEMYFDKAKTQEMIRRENNESHILVSKIFEAVLLCEIQPRQNMQVADLAAGAHTIRYEKFLDIIQQNQGKIYWVDQSRLMLDYAEKNTPENLKSIFQYEEAEMTDFLKQHDKSFNALIFKYSFNYQIPISLAQWLEIIYKSLKKGGKIVANLRLCDENGMKPRSFNALYKINGHNIESGYQPKNGEIIEVHFLKNAGDESDNPEIFASTKIVHYTEEAIRKAAQEARFSGIKIIKNWVDNLKWKDKFKELNPGLDIKTASFLILKK